MRVLLVGVALGCALVAGCGGGGGGGSSSSSSSSVAKVRATLTRELAALANGDGATACGLLTASAQAKLEQAEGGASCAQVITLFSGQAPTQLKAALRSARIGKVAIKGDTAEVQDADITSTRGSFAGFLSAGSKPTVLRRQADGTWKVSTQ